MDSFGHGACRSCTVDDGAAGRCSMAAPVSCPPGSSRWTDRLNAAMRWMSTTSGIRIARGIANYASTDVELILGRRSSEIESIVGYSFGDYVVHRDDLVAGSRGEGTSCLKFPICARVQRAGAHALASTPTETKNAALMALADRLDERARYHRRQPRRCADAQAAGMDPAMVDRLLHTPHESLVWQPMCATLRPSRSDRRGVRRAHPAQWAADTPPTGSARRHWGDL